MSDTTTIVLIFLIFIFFNPITITLEIVFVTKFARTKKLKSELDMINGECYDVIMDSSRGEKAFNRFYAMWGYVTTEELKHYYNRARRGDIGYVLNSSDFDKYVSYMDETRTVRNLTFVKFTTLSDSKYKVTDKSYSSSGSLTQVLRFKEYDIPYKRISQITRLSDNTTVSVKGETQKESLSKG